jgi:hypothetical protein
MVVPSLPVCQRRLGVRLPREAVLTPEFLLVDAMTAFHLAVLLRTARLDVPVANARRFDGQLERQRKFAAVVPSESEVKAGQVLL